MKKLALLTLLLLGACDQNASSARWAIAPAQTTDDAKYIYVWVLDTTTGAVHTCSMPKEWDYPRSPTCSTPAQQAALPNDLSTFK